MRTDGVGGVGYAGLTSCGSVWACPVCSAKILAKRQEDVRVAADAWLAGGGRLVMVTLTMRHTRSDALAALWSAVPYAWGAVTSGAVWKAEKADHGFGGYLKVVEVTHGRHGWHVHVHALFFVGPDESVEALDPWKSAVFARWNSALQRREMRSAALAAQSMVLISSSSEAFRDYFTKGADFGTAVANEFTRSASKKSRAAVGGNTPWDFLDGFVRGDADAMDLWLEYEAASTGKRQMTWSRGLRDRLGLDVELTDEQIADEELGDRSDDVIEFTREGWRRVVFCPQIQPLALQVLAVGGVRACLSFLRSLGVECFLVFDSGGAGP